MEKKKSELTEKQGDAGYTKEQILCSRRYRDRRDLIQAILEEGKTYSLSDVDRRLDNYMKGKVR